MFSSNKPGDRYVAMEAGQTLGDSYGFSGSLEDKMIRQGFMRKVFGILSMQLLMTTGVCAAFMSSENLKGYLLQNTWPMWTSMIVSFGSLIALACNQSLARSFPHNYGILAVFTAAQSVTVGFACMLSSPYAVVLAAGITTVVTLGLAAFATQTKYDFTTANGILAGALWALLAVSLAALFLPGVKAVHLAISGAGAMLFAAYLVVDLQMLMSGKRVQLSPDDYIFAALMIYLDIINLFLHILSLLSRDN